MLRNKENILKVYALSNHFLELGLDRIEKDYNIDLGRKKNKIEKDNIYYPQFDLELRNEAKVMAKHYEIFYCLERSIRDLIISSMEISEGDEWWGKKTPDKVKDEVKNRMQKERDSGITIRSDEPIDFTTFGELSEIIKFNWEIFGGIFKSIKAVERVMNNLNTLRGPIAHCSVLSEDEQLRLQLSVRDWFRLME
jgi:hypothetical protein